MFADITATIRAACEQDLQTHGDTVAGAGYRKDQAYADMCYSVMVGVMRDRPERRLLDIGCGTGQFLDFLLSSTGSSVDYHGLDLSPAAITVARQKHPSADFRVHDILVDPNPPATDYVVMNGLFNWRGPIAWEQMWEYVRAMLSRAFSIARVGIAFNTMSSHLDWERDDLFHLPLDLLGTFLHKELSRHFLIRHDYAAYEYTAYVFHKPLR